jgi:hypothetical protein
MSMLIGMIVMGYIAGSFFFLRFWRESRDRLFLIFAIAFAVLALQQIVSVWTNELLEDPVRPELYLLRVLAFLLITVAIVDKNLKARQ